MRKLLGFTAFIFTLCIMAVAAYAEVIPVYLNNTAITFDPNDAQPQIIDNRTYVPIRATCNALGLGIDWNSKTETLTLNRAGIVITHKMRSKVVTVNGVDQPFDTPSINRQNRILMPIRMLAESIGATVEWNNQTRSVHITTASAAKVSIESFTISEKEIENDDSVELKVVASAGTGKVKFTDYSTNAVLEEVSQSTNNADGTKTFTVNHNFVNDTTENRVITVLASASDGVNDYITEATSVKSANILVKASTSSTKKTTEDTDEEEEEDTSYKSKNVESIKVDSKKVDVDDKVKLTIKTNEKITKVKITNNFDDEEEVITDYEEDDDEVRTFTAKVKMTKSGSKKIYVQFYVKGSGYEETKETISITVGDSDDDDDDSSESPKIKDVELENDVVYKKQDANLTVETNTAVQYIIVRNENDKQITKVTFPDSKSSSTKKWKVSFVINHTDRQTYTLYAYNSDDDSDEESIKIQGEAWDSSDPFVLSVKQKTDGVVEGDKVKFSITCSNGTDYVEILKNSRVIETSESAGAGSDGTKSFSVTFVVDDVTQKYIARAVSDSGTSDKYTFSITGDTYNAVEIKEVELDETTYYDDEDIDVTVTTTNGAAKLWVENDRGEKLSKTYKNPTDESKDEYIWEVSFSASDDKTGNRTFTIVAQDDNKNEDTYDFKVKIKAS
ncbi:MAG: copper amine oxidase N-terminal domain-containing protein [Firmicutes bacterium]|nr:copper amine oxidase N-terminal domain-containing protein [Bacillota bacterium]